MRASGHGRREQPVTRGSCSCLEECSLDADPPRRDRRRSSRHQRTAVLVRSTLARWFIRVAVVWRFNQSTRQRPESCLASQASGHPPSLCRTADVSSRSRRMSPRRCMHQWAECSWVGCMERLICAGCRQRPELHRRRASPGHRATRVLRGSQPRWWPTDRARGASN